MKRVLNLMLLQSVLLAATAQSITYFSKYYQSVWSVPLQIPTEVRWSVQRSDIGNAERSPSWKFKSDLPKTVMWATHNDYSGTGYDRGHLCPAQDRSQSLSMMKQTFYMSNVCPQLHSINAGSWKTTENYERALAKRVGRCKVIAMPLMLERDTVRIGASGIAVPHAFLKIIYDVQPDTLYSIFFIWNK